MPDDQTTLFAVAKPPPGNPNAWKFESFHRRYPNVFQAILKVCDGIWARGTRLTSMSLIFEELRWMSDVNLNAPNAFRAYYARLVMAVRPDFSEDFFKMAKQQDPWTPDLAALHLERDGRPSPQGR
jgi:hypothetical protein